MAGTRVLYVLAVTGIANIRHTLHFMAFERTRATVVHQHQQEFKTKSAAQIVQHSKLISFMTESLSLGNIK